MTSGILTCLGFYLLLRSWSGIETVAGTDKKLKKNGAFSLGVGCRNTCLMIGM